MLTNEKCVRTRTSCGRTPGRGTSPACMAPLRRNCRTCFIAIGYKQKPTGRRLRKGYSQSADRQPDTRVMQSLRGSTWCFAAPALSPLNHNSASHYGARTQIPYGPYAVQSDIQANTLQSRAAHLVLDPYGRNGRKGDCASFGRGGY